MAKITTRADINLFKSGAFTSELTRCVTLKEVRALGLTVSSTETNENKLVKLSDIERGNTIVIVGDEGTVIKFSLLTNQYKTIKLGNVSWRSVVSSAAGYTAVGYGGYTSFSADGENWNKPKQIGTSAWLGVTRSSAGMYIAVGENGNWMYGYEDWRYDDGGNRYCVGITWSSVQKVGSTNWYTVLAFNHGSVSGFIAAGALGLGMKSSDGKNWTRFSFESGIETTNTYLCSYSNGSQLDIAGTGGVLVHSADNGVTWKTEKYNEDGGGLATIDGIAYMDTDRYLLTGMGNIIGTAIPFGKMPFKSEGRCLLSRDERLFALSSHEFLLLHVEVASQYYYDTLIDYAFATPATSSFRSMAAGEQIVT